MGTLEDDIAIRNKPLTVTRKTLYTRDHRALGKFSFKLLGDLLAVDVIGFDNPGILAYLTGKFKSYKVDVRTCFGESLKVGQGSYFDLTGPTKDDLRRLMDELLTDDLDCCKPFQPDRFFDLWVEVRHPRPYFLHDITQVLADCPTNLNYYWAETLDDQFSMFARVALPKGADDSLLTSQLRAFCPANSPLTFRERPRPPKQARSLSDGSARR